MSWRPIETAPKDGTKCIGHWTGGVGLIWWRPYLSGGGAWVGDEYMHYPTHWMPYTPPASTPIEGTVTDPAEREASQTGGPESRNTENIVSVPPSELKAKGDV